MRTLSFLLIAVACSLNGYAAEPSLSQFRIANSDGPARANEFVCLRKVPGRLSATKRKLVFTSFSALARRPNARLRSQFRRLATIGRRSCAGQKTLPFDEASRFADRSVKPIIAATNFLRALLPPDIETTNLQTIVDRINTAFSCASVTTSAGIIRAIFPSGCSIEQVAVSGYVEVTPSTNGGSTTLTLLFDEFVINGIKIDGPASFFHFVTFPVGEWELIATLTRGISSGNPSVYYGGRVPLAAATTTISGTGTYEAEDDARISFFAEFALDSPTACYPATGSILFGSHTRTTFYPMSRIEFPSGSGQAGTVGLSVFGDEQVQQLPGCGI